jgi:ATP-dependent DNA helicase PIF1
MTAVHKQKGGVFFLHGYGGTGKTFMWRTLASSLRSRSQIVLTVASSGIASLLLPGGRTAHSKFKIPVPTLDNFTCDIQYNDDLAVLLQHTKLIIWDEAPMAHRFCFEALDKSLKDVMSSYKNSETIFGGKVVVFGGDFRQILPVVPRGSRSDIVHASISSSKIWDHCKVLTLTKNMRLQNSGDPMELKKFSDWILKVGEGRLSEPNDGYAEIEIPKELLLVDYADPISAIVESTYPNLVDKYKCPKFLQSRAILASTIDVVDQINTYVLSKIPGTSLTKFFIQICHTLDLKRNIQPETHYNFHQ